MAVNTVPPIGFQCGMQPFANKWLSLASLWELIMLALILLRSAVGNDLWRCRATVKVIVIGAALTVSPVQWIERRWFAELR